MFRMNGKTMRAHRVSFFLRNGTWPELACHHCDNPRCCNPDHIYSGTVAQNNSDRDERGRARHVSGEAHGNAILKESDVLQLRSEYASAGMTMRQWALRLGVSPSVIQAVISKRTWKHL